MHKLNVIVAGSTGYIGLQLIKLLIKHKNINIKYLCGNSSTGKKISHFDNFFKKNLNMHQIHEKVNSKTFTSKRATL